MFKFKIEVVDSKFLCSLLTATLKAFYIDDRNGEKNNKTKYNSGKQNSDGRNSWSDIRGHEENISW